MIIQGTEETREELGPLEEREILWLKITSSQDHKVLFKERVDSSTSMFRLPLSGDPYIFQARFDVPLSRIPTVGSDRLIRVLMGMNLS